MNVVCKLEVFPQMLVPLYLVLILLWYSVKPPEAHCDLNIPSNCTAALFVYAHAVFTGMILGVYGYVERYHVFDSKHL